MQDGEGGQAAMAKAEFGNDFDGLFGQSSGFRFAPSGRVLLERYLLKKIAGQLPPKVDCAIPTVDLFASTAPPPWGLHPAASPVAFPSTYACNSGAVPDKVTDWFYFFTRITPRGSGFCRTTQAGTWVASGRDVEIKRGGEILGHQTALAFRTQGGRGTKGDNTGWVMHEFKLHRERKAVKEEVLVVCRIRCTKRRGWGEDEDAGVEPKRQRTKEAPGATVLASTGEALGHSPWLVVLRRKQQPSRRRPSSPSFPKPLLMLSDRRRLAIRK